MAEVGKRGRFPLGGGNDGGIGAGMAEVGARGRFPPGGGNDEKRGWG